MRVRLTSSHLVGRVGELAELELALDEAQAGQPVLVLLGGDSGIGKTRLLAEFERRLGLRDDAGLVLRGEAVEMGDGELPYGPLRGALRPLVRQRHRALSELAGGSRSALTALLPGLGDDRGAAPARDDPSAQVRLFEALLELLDLLSQEGPLVLILEDMHWADRSTRMFVAFLARSLRREAVMLVLSYRSDELHRRHPLRPLLSELERLERTRRIQLHPFDVEELAEALSDIIGDQPDASLLQRLYARAEGNPLYSEELLAAGLDGRGVAPQSLRDAFMLRIERLSANAQRAARAIAVGRALEQPLIAAVTGIDHATLQSALREAVAEQVLVADEDGHLHFRHALLREAMYDDLLPGERGELHLALARALEQGVAGGEDQQAANDALVAGHYAAAGDQPAALRAMVKAACAARDVHAYGEAASLAERALELWPRVPAAERKLPLDHIELLALAAWAHAIAGDRSRSEVLWRQALAELDPERDPRHYSAMLARLARIQWSLNRGREALDTAQQALALLPEGENSHERASLLAWLARTQHLRGRMRDALRDGEQALAIAVAAGDCRSEGEVLNTLGMAQVTLGQVEPGVARLRRAIDIARETDDPDALTTAYSNLADMLNIAGRMPSALATAREGLAATPRRLTRLHNWMALTVSEHAFEIGDWATARATLGGSPLQLTGVLLIFELTREAELALGEGEEERAARCLDELEPLVASSSEPQWIGALGALLGELRRRRGELLEARAAVEQALDRIELCTDDVVRIARVSATGLRVEADTAQRARDLRETAAARDALARSRLHMQRLKAAATAGGPVEKAWSATGAAELARARGRDDVGLWLKAAERWEAMSRPYQTAITRWRGAEAALLAGDREQAQSLAGAALHSADELGARWLAAECRSLAQRGRLTLSPAGDGAGVDAAPAADDPFGLTEREREVLALIANGATNRQIGAALFMAEKTASVHVSRILGKLGVSSRTQAAAVAHRQRLAH